MYPVEESDDTSVDSWSAHVPGPETVPTYLVSKFAAQYRVVVEVLLAAQDTSLTGMSFDEINHAVREHLLDRLGAESAERRLRRG